MALNVLVTSANDFVFGQKRPCMMQISPYNQSGKGKGLVWCRFPPVISLGKERALYDADFPPIISLWMKLAYGVWHELCRSQGLIEDWERKWCAFISVLRTWFQWPCVCDDVDLPPPRCQVHRRRAIKRKCRPEEEDDRYVNGHIDTSLRPRLTREETMSLGTRLHRGMLYLALFPCHSGSSHTVGGLGMRQIVVDTLSVCIQLDMNAHSQSLTTEDPVNISQSIVPLLQ